MEDEEKKSGAGKTVKWAWVALGIVVVLVIISSVNSQSPSSNVVVPPSTTDTPPAAPQSAVVTPTSTPKQKVAMPASASGSAVVNSSNNEVAPPAPAASWHTVYTYSNNTDIQTPPFSMQGKQWRITYNCALANSTNPYSSFNGVIDSINGGLSGGGDGHVFANNVTCPTSNTSYVYSFDFGGSLKPGQYYLDVGGYNSSYSVTVEDYY